MATTIVYEIYLKNKLKATLDSQTKAMRFALANNCDKIVKIEYKGNENKVKVTETIIWSK